MRKQLRAASGDARRIPGRWAAAGLIVSAYVLLLLGSWGWQRGIDPRRLDTRAEPAGVEVPVRGAEGAFLPGRTRRVVFDRFVPAGADSGLVPIVLLHGLPGGAANFANLGRELADRGRVVLAPDLPGLGRSDPTGGLWSFDGSYGSRAQARALLDALDELGVGRAHILGWSYGGAVAMELADLAPERTASLTLLGATVTQEAEASGSYWFEHGKYLLGLGVIGALPEALPHFGLLGETRSRSAWLRSFFDTDQRPMADRLRALRVPTLILHGRHDPLTPAWGAEHHHALAPSSRLVMLDASHFIPFFPEQSAEAAGALAPFLARHDAPGVEPLGGVDDRAPEPARSGPSWMLDRLGRAVRWWPWWALSPVFFVLARKRPETATAIAGLFCGRVDIDPFVAGLGLWLGRASRRPDAIEGRRGLFAHARLFGWSVVSLVLATTAGAWIDDAGRSLAGWAVLPLLAAVPPALFALRHLWTRTGRARVCAAWRRTLSHEWWPGWAIYLPVVPVWVRGLWTRGGCVGFTAANPGMPNGGGLAGESKHAILTALQDSPETLPHAFIDESGTPAERARRALEALRDRPELGGLPAILKPDSGERGVAVKLVRTEAQVRAYFERVTVAVVAQRYDPGPCEIGVFWVRDPATVADGTRPGRHGSVFAVTRKTFPVARGDGRRTLRRLILDHPRYRCQAGVFFERLAESLERVPAEGETVRLGLAGNHAQGCLFSDGMAMVTPALEAAVDRIARSYRGGFDMGRFDLRAPSEADLRGGRFTVVELNGVTSEPTGIYDPSKGPLFAWKLMRAQWRHAYRLGDARVAAGVRPLGKLECIRLAWKHRRPVRLRAD